MSAVLQARGIGYRRAGRDVLAGLDFDAREREIVALVGPSGSGKSSMLALLAGLEEPDEGIMTRTIGLADTAVVLQAYGLVPLLTAEENVAIPLLAPGRSPLSPAEVRRRTSDALALLQVQDLHAHLVETLSGGQQQRVALARALVVRPRLLLADEPTAALDWSNRLRVIQVLRDLRNLGSTIVLATHDPVVAAMADRVVSIKDGRNAS